MTRFLLPSLALVLALVLGVGARSPSAAVAACPGSNPPNQLVLAGGSGQTVQLGRQFPVDLQVQLANTNGCPLTGNLAGYDVDFDAPGSGASGFFASTGSRDVVVGTDGQGIASAPGFTANFTPGSYTVDAHSDFGTVELYLTNTAGGLASSIAPSGGTPQAASVDTRYAQPLQARVVDATGNPVQGVTVSFSILVGPTGGSATFLGGGPAAATTDADGVATSPPLQANGSPGRFTAVASADGVSAVATYTLDNHAAASTLSAVGGTTQSATIESRYPKRLAARVADQDGAPIEGAEVVFTLAAAGGSGGGGGASAAAGATFLGGDVQATVLTDASGIATTPPVLANGTPGVFTALATFAGSTAPVTYTLRNVPAKLVAAGVSRSSVVGRRYSHALQVRVVGGGGAPIAGVTVTFSVGKAGNDATAAFPDGTSMATVTSNASGVAIAPALTANSVAGGFEATASLAGSQPVTYTLRNRSGPPASITTGAADGSSAVLGARFPVRLAVTVADANGNPVGEAVVRFAAPESGPGGRFTIRSHGRTRSVRTVRVRTDASGVAIAPPFVASGASGGYVVSVRSGSTRAAFALVNRP